MAERADDLRDVRDRLLRLLVDDETLAATAKTGLEIREGPVETPTGNASRWPRTSAGRAN